MNGPFNLDDPLETCAMSEAKKGGMSPSHKLAIEKPRRSNEHPAGHRNDNVQNVPVSENSNSMTISDLGPGDTPFMSAKTIVYKPS